jgi:hypothetical protein
MTGKYEEKWGDLLKWHFNRKGIETNPGPHMEKMGRLLNHMVVQHEEGQKKQKLLLKNKKILCRYCKTILRTLVPN